MYSAKEKAAEARREVGYRRHVYPRRVDDGKMRAAESDRRIAIMQEIAEDYAAQAEKEDAAGRLL